MAMAKWERVITDRQGDVIPGAMIEVRDHGSGLSLVSVKADRAGTINLGNPFTASPDGIAKFFAPGGAYRVKASAVIGGQMFERIFEYEAVGTAAESDALFPDAADVSFDNTVSGLLGGTVQDAIDELVITSVQGRSTTVDTPYRGSTERAVRCRTAASQSTIRIMFRGSALFRRRPLRLI